MQLHESSSGCSDRSHQERRTFPFPSVLLLAVLCFSLGTPSLPLTHQSSLLKTMKPLSPRPKATWLLSLSHQLEKGWPSTTLRKITMFLKMQGTAVTVAARAWKPRGTWSKSNCFYFFFLLLYLTPAMFANPVVATGSVFIDCNSLCWSIWLTWWSNPVIGVLRLKRQL